MDLFRLYQSIKAVLIPCVFVYGGGADESLLP